ncbi:hypothetical protein QA640_29200 [Bradyrhizobium sp. CB82]|uniref:hypothetical protein n=1 Tax=Bradyrhizobium sp. CB82 TaxID=3039159 RepID=UPI0024B0D728|nr:hypothetical protein [Bradyrhizobium sp. CB82]WFU38486.1 hypothetical protein QA640_29200 [Bradyrhizobium sp. CB82]
MAGPVDVEFAGDQQSNDDAGDAAQQLPVEHEQAPSGDDFVIGMNDRQVRLGRVRDR